MKLSKSLITLSIIKMIKKLKSYWETFNIIQNITILFSKIILSFEGKISQTKEKKIKSKNYYNICH